MPRSSRSSGGGGRPASRPASSSSSSSSPFSMGGQNRGAHSMTAPPPRSNAAHAPPQQGQHAGPAPAAQSSGGPGLFGQMASTAAGVAVGSSIGHGISSFFGGGSRTEDVAPPADNYAQTSYNNEFANERRGGMNCEAQSKDFLRCLESTNNNMDSCSYYLEQLKQCQAAAKQY